MRPDLQLGGWRRFSAVAGTAAGIAALTVAPGAAQWRVEQGGISSGAVQSTSASYRVTGCVEHDPAGLASSSNYTVYAGCGASAVVLVGEPGSPGGPGSAMPTVPTLSELGALVLLVALAALGSASVRRLSRT